MESPPSQIPARALFPITGLVPFLKPHKRKIFFALCALVGAAAATLSMPIAVRFVIDSGISADRPDSITPYFLVLFALTLCLASFSALRFFLVSWIGERVVADIRSAVFAKLLTLGPGFYETTRSGEILSRLTTDTTLIQAVVGSSLSVALRSMLTLAGALFMLGITNPRLTGIILLLVPIIIGPIILIGRRVRRLSRASQDRVADTSAIAGEVLSAVPLVQAYRLETRLAQRFDQAVENAFATARARILTRASLAAFAVLTVFSGIVFVLWIGAQDVIAKRITGGELGQFLLYAIFVGGSTAGLSEIWGELQRAAGATDRLLELLNTQPEVPQPKNPLSLMPGIAGAIRFDQVLFHYPSRPDKPALDRFSLDVASGETIALVGPSGAGKSTVFQLILRFYQPQHGIITLDNKNIACLHSDDLRDQIALVPQATVLFADSVLENIRYGNLHATDRDVHLAAKAAAADEFIELLPDGYNTFVGERGVRLSGGQQQRLAIARALLRAAPILLLDEATSALDAESEHLVQQAFVPLLQQNRTTLVIAHRLATVLHADRIAVMDQGRIIATGSHTELLAQNGLYARLAELQLHH